MGGSRGVQGHSGGVAGGRGCCDWKRDKETDGEFLLFSSELDWFGHLTHTHHTSHTSRVMVRGFLGGGRGVVDGDCETQPWQ